MTIQRIGKNPNAAPSVAERSVWPTGIEKNTTATTAETARETSPAIQALTFSTPSSTKRVTSGIAAHRALSPSDPATGSRTCWNIGISLRRERKGEGVLLRVAEERRDRQPADG